MPEESEEIGRRIKIIREGLNLSQELFAERVGANSKAVVSTWEKGRHLPEPKLLVKIAQIGNVSLDWLLGAESSNPKQQEGDSLIIRQLKERELILRLKDYGVETVEQLDRILNMATAAEDMAYIVREKINHYKKKKG